MLSKQDNSLLTRVGPGTAMGNLLRRFWMPGLMEEEVHEVDGTPVRLRLLGEDLVAFKDSDGRIGILDAYCPHRRAHLFFGRNEECGIRCVYHGWKFDVEGNCVDMPSEPAATNFKDKVHLRSYPTAVRAGVVWIYMGPEELQPELPEFEWSRLPANQRTATKRLQQCNWGQTVEGGIDSSHISFLHNATDRQNKAARQDNLPSNALHAADRHPVFDVKETDYGLLIAARRDAGPDRYYWRITQFLLPFFQMIPPVGKFEHSDEAAYSGHAWVPIDDYNTWTWTFTASHHYPYTPEQQEFHGGRNSMWGPIDENYRPLQNIDNNYLLDRQAQKKSSFTGISGIPNQDAAVQESMGPIVDRSLERLGSSDTAIIKFRQLMLRLAKDLQAGKEPRAPHHGDWYNVRSVSTTMDRNVDWQEGSQWLIHGGKIERAAE